MKKYSFNEIKEKLESMRGIKDDTFPISIDAVIEVMKDVMDEQQVDPDDVVWEWPLQDVEDAENYDRAMGIL